MKTHKGNCPLCDDEYSDLNFESGHHILPKRFFKGKGGIYYLCRRCHNELERRIPCTKQLKPIEYRRILQDFINMKQEFMRRARKEFA